MASKKLATDFVDQLVNGVSDTTGTFTDFNLRGFEHWLDEDTAAFPDQIKFGTNDGLVTGTAQTLSLTMLDDLLSRFKGSPFEVLYSNRTTQVAYVNLLNLAGGNTAAMFMTDDFGAQFFGYRAMRWYILDQAGQEKVSGAAGGITSSDATLVIDDTLDAFWIGFSSIDPGRAITVTGAGAAAADLVTTILSVTDLRTVELSVNASTTTTTSTVTVAATNVIYACRFDDEDGIAAVYHENRGVPANAGEHYGPIAGFDAENLGLLEDSPRYRTRLDWYGNFIIHNPFAIARLSHFAV